MQIFLDWFILMNSMHMLYYTYMILTINKCSALLEIIYQRERVDLFWKRKKWFAHTKDPEDQDPSP